MFATAATAQSAAIIEAIKHVAKRFRPAFEGGEKAALTAFPDGCANGLSDTARAW